MKKLFLIATAALVCSCASQKYRAEKYHPALNCERTESAHRAKFGKWDMVLFECRPNLKIEVWDRGMFVSTDDPLADERKWARLEAEFEKAREENRLDQFAELQNTPDLLVSAYAIRIGKSQVQFLGTERQACFMDGEQVVLMGTENPRWKKIKDGLFSLENTDSLLRAWSIDEDGLFSEHKIDGAVRCEIEPEAE